MATWWTQNSDIIHPIILNFAVSYQLKKKDDMLSKNNSIEYKSKTMRKALNWKAVTDDEWKMEEIWHIKSIYKTNGK